MKFIFLNFYNPLTQLSELPILLLVALMIS